jgi:hypothetical protein
MQQQPRIFRLRFVQDEKHFLCCGRITGKREVTPKDAAGQKSALRGDLPEARFWITSGLLTILPEPGPMQ